MQNQISTIVGLQKSHTSGRGTETSMHTEPVGIRKGASPPSGGLIQGGTTQQSKEQMGFAVDRCVAENQTLSILSAAFVPHLIRPRGIFGSERACHLRSSFSNFFERRKTAQHWMARTAESTGSRTQFRLSSNCHRYAELDKGIGPYQDRKAFVTGKIDFTANSRIIESSTSPKLRAPE